MNPSEYGFSTTPEADYALKNPDIIYSDGAHGKPDAKNIYPFMEAGVRPDGQPIGSRKERGTRDVLAYTDIYFHRNTRFYPGDRNTEKPVGFYLVLWDNGQVEKVPYDKAKYLGPQGSYPFYVVFDGQAGLPTTGVHTYEEWRKWTRDNL